MSKTKKIKQEKKLINLNNIFGFIIGGVSGSIAGYQLDTFLWDGQYDGVSSSSFFLILLVGSFSGFIGFVLMASTSNS